jgi:hypothetical protein
MSEWRLPRVMKNSLAPFIFFASLHSIKGLFVAHVIVDLTRNHIVCQRWKSNCPIVQINKLITKVLIKLSAAFKILLSHYFNANYVPFQSKQNPEPFHYASLMSAKSLRRARILQSFAVRSDNAEHDVFRRRLQPQTITAEINMCVEVCSWTNECKTGPQAWRRKVGLAVACKKARVGRGESAPRVVSWMTIAADAGGINVGVGGKWRWHCGQFIALLAPEHSILARFHALKAKFVRVNRGNEP